MAADNITRQPPLALAPKADRRVAPAVTRISCASLRALSRLEPREGSGRSRPERAARRPAPDCYGAQRGRAAPELRGECSPHSARSWNLGRELRRSVSTRGSREAAVSRSGRIQFGCIPVAAGPFTPVRLVNRLLVRCLLIRASDVTVHPYSPYLVSVITHA